MIYRVVDIYDGYDDILYKGDNRNAALRAVRQRENDTDGECAVLIEERVINEYGEYEWKVNNEI